MCLPSLPLIALHFHSSLKLTKDLISLFFLGFGVSQLFYGPLSERYGRKKVVLFGLMIFNVGALLAVFSHTITQLLLMRLMQGLGAGALMVSSRAIIRDVYNNVDYIKATSYLSMSFALGLGIIPLVGSYLQHYFNWQAIFLFLFLIGMGVAILIFYKLVETNEHKQHDLPFGHYVKQVCQVCIFQWLFMDG